MRGDRQRNALRSSVAIVLVAALVAAAWVLWPRVPGPGAHGAGQWGPLAALDAEAYEPLDRALAEARELEEQGRLREALYAHGRAYALAPGEAAEAYVLAELIRLHVALGEIRSAQDLCLERARKLESLGFDEAAREALEFGGHQLDDERALRLLEADRTERLMPTYCTFD